MFSNIRLFIKCINSSNHLRINYAVAASRVQKYGDWFHRQPVKVVNEAEILQHIEEAQGPNEYLDKPKLRKKIEIDRKPLEVRPKKFQSSKKKLRVTKNDKRLKDNGKLNFTELKEDDKTLLSLMMSVRSRKQRDRNSRIILESYRLIADAIDAGYIPEIIVFSKLQDALTLPLPEHGVKLFKAPYRTIQTWSTLTTSPGIMGFFELPNTELTKPPPDAIPLTIICDNVRDPGNMGSLLRAAAAVGCKKLITLKGCVDVWDTKVLKTAAGAHFRTPIFPSKTWDDVIGKLIDPFASVFLADNNELTEVSDKENAQIIERFKEKQRRRAAKEAGEKFDEKLTAKLDEKFDQETDVNLNEEYDEDSRKKSEYEESNLQASEDMNLDDEKLNEMLDKELEQTNEIKKSRRQRDYEAKIAQRLTKYIPIVPYYGADYMSNDTVIIVGGETEGISLDALQLVQRKLGIRVNVPMTNGVESLNTSMALAIIAFEIRRQYLVKKTNTKIEDVAKDDTESEVKAKN